MSNRDFRTPESYTAEHITRNKLIDFFRNRGFGEVQDVRKSHGMTESQTVHATAPDGERLVMRIRLCWRRTGHGPHENTYSAAQLRAKVKDNDWEGTLRALVQRARSEGTTHFFTVQRGGEQITYAALVPLSELLAVWCAQRDISESSIQQGGLGRRKKNHAMNGSSPTLWLQDDRAPDVAAALWDHAGVRDLATMEIVVPIGSQQTGFNDTFDDIPSLDYSMLGSDGAPLVARTRSYVRRDPRVRRVVSHRASGKCERVGCGTARSYPGFLDVHHILGAEKRDRVWNCVAICPNCHREAHAAPDCDDINADLLRFAVRFKNHPHITEHASG